MRGRRRNPAAPSRLTINAVPKGDTKVSDFPSIPDHTKDNIRERVDLGESWLDIAVQAVKDGYRDIAAWAHEEADAAGEEEGKLFDAEAVAAHLEPAEDVEDVEPDGFLTPGTPIEVATPPTVIEVATPPAPVAPVPAPPARPGK